MRKIKTTSADGKYIERNKQYLSENTKKMIDSKLQYGINYLTIEGENINPNDKDDKSIKRYKVRVNDVYSDTQIGKRKDGYKLLVFQSSKINYIPEGTKFYFYNSTWIADNPSNLTKVIGQTNVRQCISTRNTLDYYGNIIREPLAIDKELSSTNGNTNNYIDSVSGNLACLMQLNDNTRHIKNNDRILMGGQAFQIVGLDNYTQEFTNDINSVRKLKFNIKVIEPTENDDIENNVVDGKLNPWEIKSNVSDIETKVGTKSNLTVEVFRGGQTPLKPYSVRYESEEPNIIKIDSLNGEYEAISEGSTKIKCYLNENNKIYTEINAVVRLLDVYEIRFTKKIRAIKQYSDATIRAYVFKNGIKDKTESVKFIIKGLEDHFTINNKTNNSINISCLFPNDTMQIEVIAIKEIEGREYTANQKIWLENM